MISNFEIQNKTTLQKITFGQDIEYDYIYKDDGLDWGTAPAQHNTYNYPRQVGSTISSTKIGERDISIVGYVYYFLSDEELKSVPRRDVLQYGYDILKRKKETLNNVVNPNDVLRLSINNYYIEGKASASVKYGNDGNTNNEYFCQFLITLFCSNPMFKKNTITKTIIFGSDPMLHSPFIIPPFGIVGGRRNNYLVLSVENEGNAEIGGRIILTAKGEVKNPSIENIDTGESITVNKTLQAGEVVTITTVDGKEKGITGNVNGIEENYFKYWNFNNVWFKFRQGITLIGYSTANDSENLLDVVVEINPEKFALEEL